MSDDTASAETTPSVEPEVADVELAAVEGEAEANAEVVAEADEAVSSAPEEPSEPLAADSVLLAARDQARAALTEITDADMIGADLDHEVQGEHVLTLFFESRLPGYPGWKWAATLARVDEESDVNVLEVEMLPGEDAVIAPEWVPWSERLAHYRENQSKLAADEAELAEAAAAELEDEDDVDPEDDLLDNDFSDFDDEIHGADVEDFEEIDDDDEDDDDSDEEELDDSENDEE
ncbi:DUF3027 domain-containing protein [Leucobacter viscericola]|uniref:DUF3027 domain-containing protein n=1 Tax=Leucobacter viscericola TaxID=2714935 RepID=A0A6G7XEI9_9MICO|nr:DUF3027 domain-containing protein [Leucobacter viscericola]QIK62963.1 DUF3027 domain-containing protein [Leucobacter viscericola]